MKQYNIRWRLVLYDILISVITSFVLLYLYKSVEGLSETGVIIQGGIALFCVITARFFGRIYQQIWRYGGIQCYIRLIFVDFGAFLVNLAVERSLPIHHITFAKMLAVSSINLLLALSMRMFYRYAYKCSDSDTSRGRAFGWLFKIFAGEEIKSGVREEAQKIKVAIIGAGSTGVALSRELLTNHSSPYLPRCFVDSSQSKANKQIQGLPVLLETESIFERLKEYEVQEVVFAIHDMDEVRKKTLYQQYLDAGFRIKVYDYPVMQIAGKKRALRDFDIEELLFRSPIVMQDKKTTAYYKDKVVMITGGGGSIGSELCRQLAKMNPKQIIILDIYENGAYDVQQELKIAYGNSIDVQLEIASITNKRAMTRIFKKYQPQIVINAAAHKHVPLMEKNCIEAVENNVFGTKILIDLCEEYGAERFMMVSTDKAVNPTNVMGATKRMCEMLVQAASTYGKVKYSSTRFGNVLGSAGSVIPLFKKQIASGGPVTITDKRIIRYFMTIPEASQLVLQSGAMAENGELFVLDMGKPVKILDLAENMIKLSGATDIKIVETGLRPGEKLYEELLVNTEELDKTDNSLIFIEREEPTDKKAIDTNLDTLLKACATENDELVRLALKDVVPTYRSPEEVNATADTSSKPEEKRDFATL